VSTSPKGRLALAAVHAFGAQPFDEVKVGALAATADVTTGAIYHHFDSKLGLYSFVRQDVERRLLDRMEGALAGAGQGADRGTGVRAAMVVGFDFAVREGFLHILGAPPAGADPDALAALLATSTETASPVLGNVLAAAWRAALLAVAAGADPHSARAALEALDVRIPD